MNTIKDALLSVPKFRTVKGDRVDTLASDVLSESQLLQVKSAIKRINQRMREFERAEAKYGAGYVNNATYKNLRNWADAIGTNKSGYAVQSTKNLTVAQALRTMAVANNPNASLRAYNTRALKVAEAQGIKIDKTKSGTIRMTERNASIVTQVTATTDRIHEFVEQHSSAIYALQSNENDLTSQTLVAGADSLVQGLHKGWNEPLNATDTATMLEIISMFDKKDADLQKIVDNYVTSAP